MEFVPGRTLAELIREKRLTVKRALACSHQIASALAAAHAAGIVHRDIKPGNIMVSDDGVVLKILDFGLASLEHRSLSGDSRPVELPEDTADTVLGTPSYMSPEQADGKPMDARSDIFSTGLVMYEMFTGIRAFTGDSTGSVLSRVIRDNPMAIRKFHPEVPVAIGNIISRCLEKDPAVATRAAENLRTLSLNAAGLHSYLQ